MTVTQVSRSRNFIATALIKHSQRLSSTPLKAWIAVKHTGEVIAAHCTCMAGVGEACFEQRSGRITASKLREILHTDPLQPSISLIKSICYPEMRLFTSAACKYGCDHEDTARLKYFELMGKVHKKLIVIQSGFILDPMYPFLGATPDGLVHCEWCQSGVLEIKCPYSCKDKTFTDAAQQKPFCLQENEDGSLKLKQDHSYYYQIQMQMMLCHVEYGEFVVWREGGSIHHERILFNSDFWMMHLRTLKCS